MFSHEKLVISPFKAVIFPGFLRSFFDPGLRGTALSPGSKLNEFATGGAWGLGCYEDHRVAMENGKLMVSHGKLHGSSVSHNIW